MLDKCMEEYGRGSAKRKCRMANLACLCVVESLPLNISTWLGFLKFMRKWEPRWPSISKQSMMRLVERQSEVLWKDIKREMEVVAEEMDIAFTTDFCTGSIGESFMTMSMYWITWDWHQKTHILGMRNFLEDHPTMNILEKLVDLCLEFGVNPKNSDGKTPLWRDGVRLDILLYFTLELRFDKPMLSNDCGSDVSAEAETTSFGIGIVLCLSVLEQSCSSYFEGANYRGLFGTLDGIGMQIL